MRRRFVLSMAALVAVPFTIWGATRGDDASAVTPEIVTAQRGDVAVTVGGIGHVATLTDAARLAVSSAEVGAAASAGGVPSAEAVFATATGHVTSLFVEVGDHVDAGETIAHVAGDGTAEAALLQARSDLATAQLELAQKRVQDPSRGPPPTAAEFVSGRRAVLAAQANLQRVVGSPLPSDLDAARFELDSAVAQLEEEQATKAGRPAAHSAAQLAVDAARQRLAVVTGAPDAAEVAAARLEVAQAQLEQETLLRAAPAPSAAAVAAADAEVAAAQQRLAAALVDGFPAADIATAEAELARAEADRAALSEVAAPPSAAALSAASLAVDAAQRRLDQLLTPPAATVTTARGELATARASLAAIGATSSPSRTAAAQAAVRVAQTRLDLLLDPAPETVSTVRAELARAAADLSVLRLRGAPAGRTDLAIARLRVDVGQRQVELAQAMVGRLYVVAPASGTVTSVLVTTGSAVDPALPLVRVQDLDNLVVSLNLTEFDVSRTRVGASTSVSADALGGRRYSGRVVDVALSGRDTGGVVTFPVVASLDQAKDLRPGMSVSVRIVVASAQDVVRLPLRAMQHRTGRAATITVQTGSGKVTERRVTLGLVGVANAEVRSGLRPGEKVVVPAGGES
jgi:RND family efflux transporter MFP subunit